MTTSEAPPTELKIEEDQNNDIGKNKLDVHERFKPSHNRAKTSLEYNCNPAEKEETNLTPRMAPFSHDDDNSSLPKLRIKDSSKALKT